MGTKVFCILIEIESIKQSLLFSRICQSTLQSTPVILGGKREYSKEHFMDYDAIGSDCSQKSKSIPKHGHFAVIIESTPVNGMYKRRKHNNDMTDPPKELLMLNHALQTMLQ